MARISQYSIDSLQQELEGMMHGTTLNQITNPFGAWDRAGRRVLGDVDPQETKIVSQFGKVYDGVFDYPLAADVKGNKIVDFFPQANRQPWQTFTQVYNKQFDRYKNFTLVPDFTPRYSGGVRTVRLSINGLNTGIQLNSASGYNTNGTWVAGTNVSNVGTNNLYMTDGAPGSVSFQLNQTGVPGSVGSISNSTMSAIDLTNQYNNADEFFNFYIPNASGITSVSYRFGSSAGNCYDSGAISLDQMGDAFVDGWNLVSKNWASFSTVGTPVITAINYIQVSFTYDGTLQTQVLLNQFYSRLGVIFNQEYYSKYLFRDAITDEFKENTTDVSDLVNLDTDGVNLLLYAMLGMVAQQVQGADALYYDANEAEQRYQAELANYKGKYKSELSKPHTSYYAQPRASYRRFFGRRYY